MKGSRTLTGLITHVFDHPVTDLAWYRSLDDPGWEDDYAQDVVLLAGLFEASGELLKSFTDAQLDQGLRYLVDNGAGEFMYGLIEPQVPWPDRRRALRSFIPLYEQVMAARCSPHLSHLDEAGANVLNEICYMWWDIIPIHGRPDLPERAEFDAEVLKVLEGLLAIPHDACRESALHGLGHWAAEYPAQAAEIVDAFLARSPLVRPELAAYARRARVGGVL